MIKNLLLILGPFVAIRLRFVLAVTGYHLWFLWMDIPIIALMTGLAWLRTRQERELKAETKALLARLKAVRETQETL
jgi:hypothetical protein